MPSVPEGCNFLHTGRGNPTGDRTRISGTGAPAPGPLSQERSALRRGSDVSRRGARARIRKRLRSPNEKDPAGPERLQRCIQEGNELPAGIPVPDGDRNPEAGGSAATGRRVAEGASFRAALPKAWPDRCSGSGAGETNGNPERAERLTRGLSFSARSLSTACIAEVGITTASARSGGGSDGC